MPSNGADSSSMDPHFASSRQLAPATHVHQHSEGSDNFAAPFMSNPAGATDVNVPGHSVPVDFSLYVDKVANDHQLTPKFRVMLHHFKETLVGLPQTFWAPLAYQEASVLLTAQMLEGMQKHIQEVHTVSATIRSQLVSRHALTEDQQFEVTALCKRMVFEAHRTDYDFAEEVIAELRRVSGTGLFQDVFASSAWMKTLRGFARRQSSYARNSMRRFLRDSELDGKKKSSLTKCARDGIRKFAGDGQELTPELLLHLAILRRFVREHPELLDREEPEDDGGAPEEPQQRKRKSRRGRASSDGTDFWSAVSDFFKEKDEEWGRDIKVGPWRNYIDDCIAEERRRFPEDRIALIPQRSDVGAATSAVGTTARAPALPEFAFTVPTVPRSPSPPQDSFLFSDSTPEQGRRTGAAVRPVTPASGINSPAHSRSSSPAVSSPLSRSSSMSSSQRPASRPRPRPAYAGARQGHSTAALSQQASASDPEQPPAVAAVPASANPSSQARAQHLSATLPAPAAGSAVSTEHVSLPPINLFTNGFSLPPASSSVNSGLPSLSNVTGVWQFSHDRSHQHFPNGSAHGGYGYVHSE